MSIEAGSARVWLDPGGPRMRVALRDGVVLELAPPRVGLEAGDAPLEGPAVCAQGRVKGRDGSAQRIEWQRLGGGLGLRWCVEVDRDAGGLTASLAVENRSGGPVELRSLSPLVLDAPGSLAAALWPGGPMELHPEAKPDLEAPMLLGFTTAHHGEAGEGSIHRLEAGEGHGGQPLLATQQLGLSLAPGQALESDRAWLGVGGSRAELAERWARRAGVEMRARSPRPAVHWAPPTASAGLPHLAPVALAPLRPEASEGLRLAPYPPRLSAVGDADAQEGSPLELAPGAGRLWLVAPPPLDFAGGDEIALVREATLAALGAGLVRLAGSPEDLPEERLALARRCLPPLGRPCRRVGPAALATPLVGGRLALWLGNPESEPRALGLELEALEELGAAGPLHGFDFLADEPLGLLSGEVPACEVPAGGCRIVGLTPPADRPLVIGTTLHAGMGTLEVAALRQQGEGRELVLRLPGRHTGSVWIAEPDGRLLRLEVDFCDAAELAFDASDAR